MPGQSGDPVSISAGARVVVERARSSRRPRRSEPVKYILLIYGDEREWQSLSKEEMARIYEQHRAFGDAMGKAGVMLGGYELKPVSTATSVRFARGRPKTVDGPFAETKEQLAGYYLIEAANLEEAIGWAEKMPGMTEGTVEVRPIAL
jgi:hypothetical protein